MPLIYGNLYLFEPIINPILIVEVLSPATESYDRGVKFTAYRSIPTLQEYVLINQAQMGVEHYRRQGNVEWVFRDYHSQDDMVALPSLNVTFSLADIYSNFKQVCNISLYLQTLS